MQHTVEKVGAVGSSRRQHKVWETGIDCADDENCVLRVKEVGELYRGEAPEPREPIPSDPASMRKATKKRRKHGEEKQSMCRKKPHRTRTSVREEEETITLNLRKADTVIDVSIKSPTKRKSFSRRLTNLTEAEHSSGRESNSSLRGTILSSARAKETKSTKARPTSVGGGSLIVGDVDKAPRKRTSKDPDTTNVQAISSRSKGKGKGVRKCHQGTLHRLPSPAVTNEARAVPSPNVKEAGPSALLNSGALEMDLEVPRRDSNTVQAAAVAPELESTPEENLSFTFPAADTGTVHAGGLLLQHTPESVANAAYEVVDFPAEEATEVAHVDEARHVAVEVESPAQQQCPITSEEVSLNPEQKTRHAQTRKASAAPITPGRELSLIPEPSTIYAQSEKATTATTTLATELSRNAEPKRRHAETDKVTTETITPPRKVTNLRQPLACHLTVAGCLAAQEEARERSLSPTPLATPSLPHLFSPRSRPPRSSIPCKASSPVAMTWVPNSEDPSGTEARVTCPEEVTKSLDNLLNQLPPHEMAKYFSRKANELGENLQGTKEKNTTSKRKDRMEIDSSAPFDFDSLKKEKRRQRRQARKHEAEKQQAEKEQADNQQAEKQQAEKLEKMKNIEKAIQDLQRQAQELQCDEKDLLKLAVPSPRKSKGHPSKRPVVPPSSSKGIQVCISKGGGKRKSVLLDSSTNTLPESHVISDIHSIGIWDNVTDVPPCEVNSLGQPIGQFWAHMQNYIHSRAPYVFEWDIPWRQQPKDLKRAYAHRIRCLYPGKYEIDYVLEDIGANIRQRRQRTRNHMKKNGCKHLTPIAHGLTVKSWNNIWAQISNPTYQEKSKKCKVAADARTDRIGYTHRLGAMGVAGLMKKFEEEFHRPPTEEEVQLGKREGVRGLFDIIRNRYNKKLRGTEDVQQNTVQEGKTKKKRPHLDSSRDSDEESARTSSDDDEEEVSYKESRDSSTSGSGESSSEGSDESEGEDEGTKPISEEKSEDNAEEGEGISSEAATSDHSE